MNFYDFLICYLNSPFTRVCIKFTTNNLLSFSKYFLSMRIRFIFAGAKYLIFHFCPFISPDYATSVPMMMCSEDKI